MTRIPVAVFGVGAIGKTHVAQIVASERLCLAGVADPTDAAQHLAEQHGVPWFASHTELLDTCRPRAAIIATPNALHVDMALDCLARGIPALIEKPVADTVESAQRLTEAQQRSAVPLLVGHHRRHNPINQRARQIIQGGQLGTLVTAHVMATFFKPDSYFDLDWRRQPGGGPVLINLIHEIDMLRFLCGEIASIQAQCSHAVRGFPVEDSAAVIVRFTQGALGTLILSDTVTAPWMWDFCAGEQDQYPRQTVQSHFIGGTHGSLSLPDLQQWSYRGARSWHAELTGEQTRVRKADPYQAQLAHFADVIEGRSEPLCNALDGLRTLQATLAVAQAAQSGQIVTLSPPETHL